MLNLTLRLILALTLVCAAFVPDAALASKAASARLEAAVPRAAPGTHITWPPTRPALRFWLPVRIVTASRAAGPGWLLPAHVVEVADRLALPPGHNPAEVNLAAGDPFTVTLQANPTSLTVGNTSQLTAVVTDEFDNPVTDGTVVNFTTDLGTIDSPTTTVNGTATASTSSNDAGTATVTAASGSAPPDTVDITFQPGAPSSITLQANPTSQTVGSSSQLTAVVTDEFGNPVTDGTVVNFTTSLGTISSPTTTVNGTATATTSSTQAGTASVSATSGSATPGTVNITFQPGAPSSITLQANPTSLTVGNTSQLTAVVKDQYNNPVANGTVVNFTTSLGTINSPTTTSNGTATATTSSTQPGTATISAASGSAPPDTVNVTFQVGPAASITLQANPTSLTVGNTSQLTAVVKDQYNNPVANGTVVNFTTDLGTISSPTTTVNGTATATTSSTQAGTASVSAASGSATLGTVGITFQPGPPSSITLQANPTSLAVGNTSHLTAIVRDQYNNPVANGTVVNFTTSLGTISSPTTTSNGTATATTSSTQPGTATVSAVSGSAPPATVTVTFQPGAPSSITLQANPTSLAVGQASLLTATVRDQYNNPVVNGTVVTFTTNLGTINSPTPTTVNGTATATITSIQAGMATVSAASGSAPPATVNITFLPGAPSSITLQANPTSLTVGQASLLTAMVKDQYNNAVANGTLVTFTTTYGSIAPSATTTAGVATSSISTTISGTARITATGGLANSAPISVTFNPGPPSVLRLTPDTAQISAGQGVTYTSVATDVYGNRIGNVTANTSFAAAPGSGVTISNNVIRPTLKGTYTVTGTNTAIDTANINVQANGPFTVTLQANPTTLTVGQASLLTAVVTDEFGNPVADGTVVTFTTNLGTINSPTPTTVNGTATATITSIQAGMATVSAASGSAPPATVNITFLPGAPSSITLQANPTSLTVGQASLLTAMVKDQYNNAVANGTLVTFTTNLGTINSPTTTVNGTATATTSSTQAGTATVSAASGSATSAPVIVTFNPGPPSRLAIESPLGTEIGAHALTTYQTQTYYAVRYDQFGNKIDQPSASWAGTGVVAGKLSPTTGVSTTLSPAGAGTGVINASFGGITDTTGTITVQAPDLIITKLDSPDPVLPGNVLRYTLIFTNVGTAATQGIVITDTYDPNAPFQSATIDPEIGNTPGATQTVWTTSAGNLAPNESRSIQVFTVVGSSLPVGTVLTNTARISGPELTQRVDVETTQVTLAASLTISKAQEFPPGSSVRVSDTIIYHLTYANPGTALLHNIVVTETYDPKVQYATASPPPSVGNNRWNIASLAAGQTGSIFVNVIVKAPQIDGATLANTVSIDSDETAPSSVSIPPIPIQAPMLSLSHKAAPSPVQANAPLTYTLSYTNSGSTYASSTEITTLLPSNVVFVSAQPAYSQRAGSLLTWNLGQVGSHTTGRITISVLVNNNIDNGTVITAFSRISAAEIVSASAQVSTVVNSAPNVALSVSDGVASAAAGQTLTYNLVYTNAGNAQAQGVVITDRIPSNVVFQSCTGCTQGSGLYTFTLGTLDAGAGGLETISVRVNSPLPAGLRSITNTAGIRTTTPGDTLSDNQAQDVDAISTVPTLAIRASFDTTTPYPTKVITYSIQYTNTSDMHTTGVVISATKSAYVNYTSTGSSAWIPAGGRVYTYRVGNLAARASGLVTFVVSLPYPYITGTTGFTNVFAIRDNGPGGLPVATSSTTTLLGVPDLVIERVIIPDAVVVSRTFTATVVIRNQGTGRACNPANCGGYWLDTFIDPDIPPPSFPYTVPGQITGYGQIQRPVTTLNAGASITVPVPGISFTLGQDLILYFKVDNYDCPGTTCSPDGAQHGLVPEGNEYNNVKGPVQLFAFQVRLPAIYKQR